MKTYQDLQAVGENEINRMQFVKDAIAEHISSDFYKTARDAELYYEGKNVAISNFVKIIYKATGEKIKDVWSANYKIGSSHYFRFTLQKVQFELGNGVTFQHKDTYKKLGEDFDTQMQKGATYACNGGVAFGFYNLDHLEMFKYTEFAPLYDEENSYLMAGIRHWQIDNTKPLRAVLYEIDGYTEYMWYDGCDSNFVPSDEWVILGNRAAYKPKKAYKYNIAKTEAGGVENAEGENYPTFPIVPLWGNTEKQSDLVRIRPKQDAYDFTISGFANVVDDSSVMYWVMQGAGGMDDADLQQFMEKIKTLKAVNLPPDVKAEPNTINIPYQSSEALLDRLDKEMYRDAMALDVETIANGAVNTTQIKAAYEPLCEKCDSFEYCIIDFIKGILKVAGIDDNPTFTRSMIANTTEEIQATIQAAPYMAQDDVVTRLYELLGMGDKAAEALNKIEADNYQRFDETEEAVE